MVMRTYGLSGSGMDIDQLVKDLMKARRTQYDNLYKTKTQLEWKKSDYVTIYNSINTFRSQTVFNYTLDSTLQAKAAASSNETVLTAKANADAADMSHSLVVSQLADGVKMTSAGAITAGANKDSLASQFGLAAGTSFDITVSNGDLTKTLTVNTDSTIYDLVGQINNAGVKVRANYDATLDRFFINTTNSGSAAEIDFAGSSVEGMDFLIGSLKLPTFGHAGTTAITSSAAIGVADPDATLASEFGMAGSFNIRIANGASTADIAIDTSVDTLNTVIGKLNAAGVNASAVYDAGTDTFSLAAASGTLDLTGSDAAAFDFFANKLNLSEKGQDAKFTLDGVSLTQTANTFTVSGVTYTLKSAGATTVNVTSDIDKTVETVKSFVESYNKILAQLYGELEEPKYKSYLPLTSEEKAALKDSEVTEWEKYAKSGLLRNDSILRDAVYKMRSDISTPVSGLSGKYTSAASIGITTGSYLENGKLYFDESKLRKALEEDPDALKNLFRTDGSTAGADGIAVRLYDNLKVISDRLSQQAGVSASALYDTTSILGKQINSYTSRMTALNSRLEMEEDRYYAQFDAMEVALSRLNQQSSWLTSQLSGL